MKHVMNSFVICVALVVFPASAQAQNQQPTAQPQPKIQQVENATDYYAQYRTPPFIAANNVAINPNVPANNAQQPVTLFANPNYPYSAPRVYVPVYNYAPFGYYRPRYYGGYYPRFGHGYNLYR